MADMGTIPEIISTMYIKGDEDVDTIVAEALAMHAATPRCFCRNLRLCCVASPELAPAPQPMQFTVNHSKISQSSTASSPMRVAQQRSKHTSGNGRPSPVRGNQQWAHQDRLMAAQTARSCLMLQAQDLITYLGVFCIEGNEF